MAVVNNKYSFKDAYRLLRAISTKAKEIADSKEQMIIAQLEKSEEKQDRTNFGLLSLKNNAEKTIKVYTEEEQVEVDRLQAEIAKLKAEIDKLGTSKVTNVVSLGVLSSVCEIVSKDYLAKGVEKVLGEKKKSLLPLNEQALSAGADSLCVSQ